MNIQKNLLSFFLIVFLLGGCASTNFLSKKSIPLPAGTLNKSEVQTLFSDKTVKSVLDKNGRISMTYYNPNGELLQLQKGKMRAGNWQVREDGRICLQMEGKDQGCRIIVKEQFTYRKYIVKRDGNHQPIITYTSFSSGNLLDR